METQHFFKGVAALDFAGRLNMTLHKEGDCLTVSLLLQNDSCGDAAKGSIPPLVLKGTAEELDSGFFATITEPLQQTSGLLVNMEAYLKQREAARAQSAMEKDNAEKERKELEGQDKKYNEALLKVDELEQAGRFKQAWAKVPDPAKYPAQAEFLRSRRKGLSDQFGPDLFNTGAAENNGGEEEENQEYDEDNLTEA